MREDVARLQPVGWLALALIVLGGTAPTAAWFCLSHRFDEDLAWQEGLGFFVFVGCLGVLALFQVFGLILAKQAWVTAVGKVATVSGICLLSLVLLLVGMIVPQLG